MKKFILSNNGFEVNFYIKDGHPTVEATSNGHMYCKIPCTKELGNFIYKKLLKSSYLSEVAMDDIFLTVCIYYNDFDGYSDNYKDVHGFRPRPTQEEWNKMVADTLDMVERGAV